MTLTRMGEPACRQVLSKLDPYIDNELLAESNLELMDHFRTCPSCTGEARERREVRGRLRAAAREVPLPPGLEDRVRQRLRESRKPPANRFHLMAIAATLAVCVGSWAAYRFGAPHLAGMNTILQAGLDDHVHCAVIRQKANPPKEPTNKLSPEWRELLPVVERYVPSSLPFSLAHECHVGNRTFIHLTFRNEDSMLSLVIARKQDGESLSAAKLLPALSESGIPIYRAGSQQFQVAAFEESQYLVFTISDLPARKNLDVMAALAPVVRRFLDKVGA
jgi:hypothetical protein